MSLYLWYSKSTSVTGRALAKKLGLTRRSSNDPNRGYGTLPPPIGTTKCICWGARVPQSMTPSRERRLRRITYLNSPFDSEQYKDKLKALIVMKSCGVNTPKTYSNNNLVFNRSHISRFPVIGRTRHHQGGSGFKFIENAEQLIRDNTSDHWLEYIDGEDKREYRVHVFKGRVIKVSRKKPKLDERGEEIEPRDYRCRSHSNGWRFSNCDISRTHRSIVENAVKAVRALNMEFGAVDIIRVPRTNTTVVLEVNSGMGLDNAGLELYSQIFEEWKNGFRI